MDRTLIELLYTDNRAQLRHHEAQRSAAAHIILAVIAALLALLLTPRLDLSEPVHDAVYWFCLGFAVYGWIFTEKLNERVRLHQRRAHALRDELGSQPAAEAVLEVVRRSHRQTGREILFLRALIGALHLRWLWRFAFVTFIIALIWHGVSAGDIQQLGDMASKVQDWIGAVDP